MYIIQHTYLLASYPGLPSQHFSQPWKNAWGKLGRKHHVMSATVITANYLEEVKRYVCYYSLFHMQQIKCIKLSMILGTKIQKESDKQNNGSGKITALVSGLARA